MSATAIPSVYAAPPDLAELQDCLPSAMRGAGVAVTRIAVGMSGAGVYRVDTVDQSFVLKLTSADEPVLEWRNRLEVQRAAAGLGIAPAVVHVHEPRRAVLSALVVDRSFAAQLGDPDRRDGALEALGRMLGQRRELPIPPAMQPADPARALEAMWQAMPAAFTVPSFVRSAVQSLLVLRPSTSATPLVMSHNDVNPTNLVFDGARVMLVDWQVTAPNHPLYDLAAIAMFFRLDDAAVCRLIAAHDGALVDEMVDGVPETFRYYRRCAAVLSGVAALHASRSQGHQGGNVAIDATPSLSEVYQQLRSGAFDIRTADGQWTFGLALVKEGVAS